MRLLIGKTVAVILLTVGFGIQSAQAQIVASNPLEWMALAEGNDGTRAGALRPRLKGPSSLENCNRLKIDIEKAPSLLT